MTYEYTPSGADGLPDPDLGDPPVDETSFTSARQGGLWSLELAARLQRDAWIYVQVRDDDGLLLAADYLRLSEVDAGSGTLRRAVEGDSFGVVEETEENLLQEGCFE